MGDLMLVIGGALNLGLLLLYGFLLLRAVQVHSQMLRAIKQSLYFARAKGENSMRELRNMFIQAFCFESGSVYNDETFFSKDSTDSIALLSFRRVQRGDKLLAVTNLPVINPYGFDEAGHQGYIAELRFRLWEGVSFGSFRIEPIDVVIYGYVAVDVAKGERVGSGFDMFLQEILGGEKQYMEG